MAINNQSVSVEPLSQRLSQDLTRNGELSISKALLNHCDPEYSALQLYRIYFENLNLVAADSNVSALLRFPDAHEEIRNEAFRISQPSKEPDQFSIFSPNDVNRLSRLLGQLRTQQSTLGKEIVVFIVLYYCKSVDKISGSLKIVHDCRWQTFDAPLYDDPSKIHQTIYFCLHQSQISSKSTQSAAWIESFYLSILFEMNYLFSVLPVLRVPHQFIAPTNKIHLLKLYRL